MQNVRQGDILLYSVVVREKGIVADYYGCEFVGSVTDGTPLNLSGEPITGVRAIYRLSQPAMAAQPGRILLSRRESDPGETSRLSRELTRIYGPGELITSMSCQCEMTCGMLKKRL